MLVQALETPNPHSVKFVPPCHVRGEAESLFFRKADSVAHAPFAERIFGIPGVEAVFLGSDFITVTKNADSEWYALKPAVLGLIVEFLTQKTPMISDENVKPAPPITPRAPQASHECGSQPAPQNMQLSDIPQTNLDDPIVQEIIALINDRVRPAVAQDGGDIIFQAFHDGVVYLSLQGACSGCPSSQVTLKNGVENMLKYYVPEVLEVRSVDAS